MKIENVRFWRLGDPYFIEACDQTSHAEFYSQFPDIMRLENYRLLWRQTIVGIPGAWYCLQIILHTSRETMTFETDQSTITVLPFEVVVNGVTVNNLKNGIDADTEHMKLIDQHWQLGYKRREKLDDDAKTDLIKKLRSMK